MGILVIRSYSMIVGINVLDVRKYPAAPRVSHRAIHWAAPRAASREDKARRAADSAGQVCSARAEGLWFAA